MTVSEPERLKLELWLFAKHLTSSWFEWIEAQIQTMLETSSKVLAVDYWKLC